MTGSTISELLAGSGLCDQPLGDLLSGPIPTFGLWSGWCRDSSGKAGRGSVDLKTGKGGRWRLCVRIVDSGLERERRCHFTCNRSFSSSLVGFQVNSPSAWQSENAIRPNEAKMTKPSLKRIFQIVLVPRFNGVEHLLDSIGDFTETCEIDNL